MLGSHTLPAHACRVAAALLAEACGRQGHLHLAAWLLHWSLGAAMRLQYQLVLYSRRQQLVQRQRRRVATATSVGDGGSAGSDDLAAQVLQLEQLAAGLEPGLDWQLVLALAGGGNGADGGATSQPGAASIPPARSRKAAAAAAAAAGGGRAPAGPAPSAAAALAALDEQAGLQLAAWQSALPAGTAACSITVLPSSDGGSLLISRLAPASGSDRDGGRNDGSGSGPSPPPLLVCLPVQPLSASLSQHPIRALRMDVDSREDTGGSGSSTSRYA